MGEVSLQMQQRTGPTRAMQMKGEGIKCCSSAERSQSSPTGNASKDVLRCGWLSLGKRRCARQCETAPEADVTRGQDQLQTVETSRETIADVL
jgi:hypothetical protein